MSTSTLPHPQQAVIDGVITAMSATPSPALTSFAVAAHPWTNAERWDYTRTWSVSVTVGGIAHSVRGHVHYSRKRTHPFKPGGPFASPASYTSGPGRYWISGVLNWDAATPQWAVTKFSSISDTERTTATSTFNKKHPGTNLPIR